MLQSGASIQLQTFIGPFTLDTSRSWNWYNLEVACIDSMFENGQTGYTYDLGAGMVTKKTYLCP